MFQAEEQHLQSHEVVERARSGRLWNERGQIVVALLRQEDPGRGGMG